MRKVLFIAIVATFVLLAPSVLLANEFPTTIRLKTDFNIWKVNLKWHDWLTENEKQSWNGFPVKLPSDMDQKATDKTAAYLHNTLESGLDFGEVNDYLERFVTPDIHREKQDVTITMDDDGNIVFDGFAISGQEVDFERAPYVIKEAILSGETEVRLPIKTIPPKVIVESDELKEMGIVGLLATGETDFSGSPYNRRTNIRVGLNSYNGWLIAPGEKASVLKRLGAVNEYTGYLPELVIKGDKTIPEYGGGLCQVSTTVYRSLLFAGFPINERRNHSYAVSYYDPQGLDATIYIPNPDLKFTNDTSDHVLIQTAMIGDKAYSNVYGTSDNRHVELIGPYYYDYRQPPPSKVEYTDQLEPGKVQQVGGAHSGFQADWYRRISYAEEDKEEKIERIHSNYQARPDYKLIGETPAEVFDISANGT